MTGSLQKQKQKKKKEKFKTLNSYFPMKSRISLIGNNLTNLDLGKNINSSKWIQVPFLKPTETQLKDMN